MMVTVQPRTLNDRLWELCAKETRGTISAAEKAELDRLCAALDAGQDIHPKGPTE